MKSSYECYLLSLCGTNAGIDKVESDTNFKVICAVTLMEKDHEYLCDQCTVFSEAEKFGVLEKDILFAAHADKDRNGVYCDNWLLVTEEEIVMVGGIQLVVPREGVKRRDPKKLTVKYGKISEYRF